VERVKVRYSENIEEAISRIEREVMREESLAKLGSRWIAIKLLEGDEEVRARVASSKFANKILKVASEERERLRRAYGLDPEVVLANERYKIIEEIVSKVTKGTKRVTPTDLIDKVILDKYLGIPIFFTILWAIFEFTMEVSSPFCDFLGDFFNWISSHLSGLTGNPMLDSLLFGDYGLLNGLGTVLSFVPLIFFLYFSLAILEDSGYMARAAFVMDRLMRKVGLTGRAMISMIVGFGCNVPAVYSTRAIPGEEDRLVATIINPLIPCSARLTVFSLLAYTFFKGVAGDVILSLYLIGIALALIVSLIFRRVYLKGRTSPFVMELPLYQLPTLKSILLHTWNRTALFIRKAGTVILAGLLAVSVLMHIAWPSLAWINDVNASVIAEMGKAIWPLFKPLGWDWRLTASCIFGFIAKEVIIGSMSLLYGVSEANMATKLSSLYTPLQIYSFMVFTLIYIPCIATVAAIAHERGWKWALFTVLYGLALAYVVALLIYLGGSALGFR